MKMEFLIFIPNTAAEMCPDESQYRCEYYKLLCIDEEQLCNGHIDCPNWDDEQACPESKYNFYLGKNSV